jgi:hypothetical protein
VTVLFNAVNALHVVGALAIAWGYFSQLRLPTKGINAAMLHGASTQFATGLVMVGLAESGAVDESFSTPIVAAKLLGVVAILVACVLGRRQQGDAPRWWLAVGVLWLVNVALGLTLSG